ncbi:MAG: hypothetical protein JSW11_02195 [Candidatus Heimdallarchaeota archaeon]|nr:MAG: hypothetical protein JSW11_02195 [Candidatus Heimdallarchaeota archaeon]
MSGTDSGTFARRFTFRPFDGIRRGRVYRLCAISWYWWTHQWKRSRAAKILMVILIFFFILTNLLLFSFIEMKQVDSDLSNIEIFEGVLLQLVRGVVSFQTEFYGSGEGSESIMMTFGGLSLFILAFMVMIGSGLIADDISNNTLEIYFSKLERHEYIIGKFGAFVIFGNITLTLPFFLEFFLLFIGIGGIDLVQSLPILIDVIIITELIIFTFASIFLAFSAVTNKLYAGAVAYMLLFISNIIIPPLAFVSKGEVGLVILLDILTVLLISSYIIVGTTDLHYISGREFYDLNLASGQGLESWIVLGALGIYFMIGFLVVILTVYWKHRK